MFAPVNLITVSIRRIAWLFMQSVKCLHSINLNKSFTSFSCVVHSVHFNTLAYILAQQATFSFVNLSSYTFYLTMTTIQAIVWKNTKVSCQLQIYVGLFLYYLAANFHTASKEKQTNKTKLNSMHEISDLINQTKNVKN